MDYEKLYKEALERAKYALTTDMDKSGHWAVNYIFPTLKESEDEKIRKEIISLIQNGGYMSKEFKEKAFAWLEKQRYSEFELENEYWRGYDDAKFHLKEDKVTIIGSGSNSASVSDGDYSVTSKEVVSYPTTIKPKFKVGDFIVNDYCMGRVVELTNDAYLLDTEQGIPFSYEHDVHLWTIQDAKDGDIIYIKRHKDNSEWLLIFKGIKSQNTLIDVYDYYAYSITTNNTYHQGFCGLWGLLLDDEIVCPATKEQCNLLFAKMKEEGYEWDAENKVLKKIDWSNHIKYEPNAPSIIKESAWSEEDEYTLNETIQHLKELIRIDKAKHLGCDVQYYQRDIDWLKSLKERIK